MKSRITLRQLEAFVAVARALSFSEAARRVHLSQPALSAAIRKLEDAVDAQLFDRTTRRVQLSSVGRELLHVVERLFDDFDAALESVREFVEGKRGRLAIAASPSLAAAFLPEVISKFEPAHPRIALQVHDALSDVAIEMVRTGQVDLALAPERIDDAELTHRELFEDSLVLLCRTDHPLAARRTVTWRQLHGHRLVSLKSTSSVRHLVEAALIEHGGEVKPAFEVEHASTVIGFVANGLGVGVLPLSLLPLVRVGQVTYRRITGPEIRRAICVVASRARSLSPAAEAFVELCVLAAKQRGDTSKPSRGARAQGERDAGR
ncbi:MAG: LysR family transcriptional regulator [Burkholderiales bacterium]|nr:LysR family transcriptional regulator [Burkholderiales bacterium]